MLSAGDVIIDGGRAYARNRETGKEPANFEEMGWERYETQYDEGINPKKTAESVGWADDVHLYLDKDAAYARRGGIRAARRHPVRHQAAHTLGCPEARRAESRRRRADRHLDSSSGQAEESRPALAWGHKRGGVRQ